MAQYCGGNFCGLFFCWILSPPPNYVFYIVTISMFRGSWLAATPSSSSSSPSSSLDSPARASPCQSSLSVSLRHHQHAHQGLSSLSVSLQCIASSSASSSGTMMWNVPMRRTWRYCLMWWDSKLCQNMTTFESFIFLFEVQENLDWVGENFPDFLSEVRCIFYVAPESLFKWITFLGWRNVKISGEREEEWQGSGGCDHPGRECSSTLCDAPGLPPSPGLTASLLNMPLKPFFAQKVRSLTVEDCDHPDCKEDPAKLANNLVREGGEILV